MPLFHLFVVCLVSGALGTCGAGPVMNAVTSCASQAMASYELTVETFWTQESFPKQFPLWRPHAQWSRMIGRSHNHTYSLWRLGEKCNTGVREFAETGKSDVLDLDTQGHAGIFDVFSTPKMETGARTESVHILADPNHSQMSLLMRLVPSPDWFVGVDALPLCDSTGWVKELTQNLGIYDAGTDKGYTFSAPNWAENPTQPITTITSKFPNHLANSFFYPDLPHLPIIAQIRVKRLGTHHTHAQKQQPEAGHGVVTKKRLLPVGVPLRSRVLPNNAAAPRDSPQVPTTLPTATTPRPKLNQRHGLVGVPQPRSTLPPKTTTMTKTKVTRKIKSTVTPRPVAHITWPAYCADRSLRSKDRKTRRKQNRECRALSKQRKQARRGMPVDCMVGEWGEWGACTKPCGFGTRSHRRTVITVQTRGGRPCSSLTEDDSLPCNMHACRKPTRFASSAFKGFMVDG